MDLELVKISESSKDRKSIQSFDLTEEEEEEPRNISDVSITGFGRVFGRRIATWKRCVWIVVLVTCFGLTLSQVWDRGTYYRSTPVNVNVRVTRNVSLKFPLITFCNKNMYNVTALNELRQLRGRLLGVADRDVIANWDIEDVIGLEGRNAKDVWDATSHNLTKMMKECWFGRGIKCEDVGNWNKVYTIYGVCYQFRKSLPVYVSGVFNNMYIKLRDLEKDKYKEEKGFKVHIHDPKDDALIDVRTHGSTVEKGWGKDARVTVREFKTIPTYARPCVTEPDYSSSQCVSKCFIKSLLNKTDCLMPYMEDPTKVALPCSSPETYKLGLATAKELLFHGEWRPTSCDCPKQCDENIYTVFTEAVQTGFSSARLRIFFQDLTYDEVSEEMAYDTIALLCDIGGTLGLLLGASVLTFFELLEIGCEKVAILFKKPRQ